MYENILVVSAIEFNENKIDELVEKYLTMSNQSNDEEFWRYYSVQLLKCVLFNLNKLNKEDIDNELSLKDFIIYTIDKTKEFLNFVSKIDFKKNTDRGSKILKEYLRFLNIDSVDETSDIYTPDLYHISPKEIIKTCISK